MTEREAYTVGDLLAEEAPRLPIALVAGRRGIGNRIDTAELRRPGLALAGYLGGIDPAAVYVFGRSESGYLETLPDGRREALERFFEAGVAALLLAGSTAPPPYLVEAAEAKGVPLLVTSAAEGDAVYALDLLLERRLAPTTSMHGVLLDVFGMGALLIGESGIGKSETALELVQHGHRLVADDVVQIRRAHGETLVGTGAQMLRHHMELRGIGVIDVLLLFGAASVLDELRIDLVVEIEAWQEGKAYERIGLDRTTTRILGVEIPSLLIPVRPGRNLSVIVEAAVTHHRLRSMGHDVARAFNERLTQWIAGGGPSPSTVRRLREVPA